MGLTVNSQEDVIATVCVTVLNAEPFTGSSETSLPTEVSEYMKPSQEASSINA